MKQDWQYRSTAADAVPALSNIAKATSTATSDARATGTRRAAAEPPDGLRPPEKPQVVRVRNIALTYGYLPHDDFRCNEYSVTLRPMNSLAPARIPTALKLMAASAGAALGAALWWRSHPSACPYGQRFWVEAPHPLITRSRLLSVLRPQPGEQLLEVGPGTGYYSLSVARELVPEGLLDVFDLQQQMLDHTMRRAKDSGVGNIRPTRGDARHLPYDDGRFDGAFLITVLGEIPDRPAALRELARVLRPGGRLVVGEIVLDPHWVSPGTLQREATDAGFEFEHRSGSPLGYFARFKR